MGGGSSKPKKSTLGSGLGSTSSTTISCPNHPDPDTLSGCIIGTNPAPCQCASNCVVVSGTKNGVATTEIHTSTQTTATSAVSLDDMSTWNTNAGAVTFTFGPYVTITLYSDSQGSQIAQTISPNITSSTANQTITNQYPFKSMKIRCFSEVFDNVEPFIDGCSSSCMSNETIFIIISLVILLFLIYWSRNRMQY